MAENKFLNKKTAAVGAGLVAAYLIYKSYQSSQEAKEGMPQGSIGGEDDLGEQQGFDIDPNSYPSQTGSPYPYGYPTNPDDVPVSPYFEVTPEGDIQPSSSPTGGSSGGTSGIPSTTPTYSTGSGSLVSDAAVVAGATGFNLLLPNLAKGIKSAVDSKYAFRAAGDLASESNFQKWLKDPYNIGDSATSKVMREGEQTALKQLEQGGMSVAQSAEKPVVREAGEQVLQTMPKWAKGIKGVANFIPLLDIPIGAGLDVWFSRYEDDPNKKIGWGDALAANTAGELAQLGITGAAAAAGTVVPVAGNIAGGVGGFIVGTGADIAATEAYYKARGKSSLFDLGGSSASQQQAQASAAQQQSAAKLLGLSTPAQSFSSGATYNPATYTFISSSGAKMSMSPENAAKQGATVVSSSSSSKSSSSSSSNIFSVSSANPFSSSSSSTSSKTSSSSQNVSQTPKSTPQASVSTVAKTSGSGGIVSTVTKSVSGAASTVSKAATSAASSVKSAVTSTVSKISSLFSSKSSSKKK